MHACWVLVWVRVGNRMIGLEICVPPSLAVTTTREAAAASFSSTVRHSFPRQPTMHRCTWLMIKRWRFYSACAVCGARSLKPLPSSFPCAFWTQLAARVSAWGLEHKDLDVQGAFLRAQLVSCRLSCPGSAHEHPWDSLGSTHFKHGPCLDFSRVHMCFYGALLRT